MPKLILFRPFAKTDWVTNEKNTKETNKLAKINGQTRNLLPTNSTQFQWILRSLRIGCAIYSINSPLSARLFARNFKVLINQSICWHLHGLIKFKIEIWSNILKNSFHIWATTTEYYFEIFILCWNVSEDSMQMKVEVKLTSFPFVFRNLVWKMYYFHAYQKNTWKRSGSIGNHDFNSGTAWMKRIVWWIM